MNKLNPHRTGLAVGVFVGLVHLVWAVFVSLGLAAGKLKFLLGLHFLNVPFDTLSFSWGGGLVLIVLSSIGGYIMATVFSFVWNKVAAR